MDEIWDLFESVSEGFPTYSCKGGHKFQGHPLLLKSQKIHSKEIR